MYGGAVETREALQAFGLPADLVEEGGREPEVIGIYPENWLPYAVFSALATQWQQGMGGPGGLKYEVLPVVEERLGVKKKRRADVFTALRVMEDEVLKVFSERRN